MRIADQIREDHSCLEASISLLRSGIQDLRKLKSIYSLRVERFRQHSQAEERSLYAYGLGEPNLRQMALRSSEEHRAIQSMAARVSRSASKEQWLARAEIFCNQLEQHLKWEESVFLPQLSSRIKIHEEAGLQRSYRPMLSAQPGALRNAKVLQMPIRARQQKNTAGPGLRGEHP